LLRVSAPIKATWQRYCRLLATELTDTERQFVHNRTYQEDEQLECQLDTARGKQQRPLPLKLA
jgi:hypothetical protein